MSNQKEISENLARYILELIVMAESGESSFSTSEIEKNRVLRDTLENMFPLLRQEREEKEFMYWMHWTGASRDSEIKEYSRLLDMTGPEPRDDMCLYKLYFDHINVANDLMRSRIEKVVEELLKDRTKVWNEYVKEKK